MAKDKNLKTLKSYVIGFVLSLLLTFVSFYLASKQGFSHTTLMLSIMLLAVVQLFVQAIFFLRLNAGEEGRWSLMPFLFVVLIVLVLVFGSLWIMINLNYNMMH